MSDKSSIFTPEQAIFPHQLGSGASQMKHLKISHIRCRPARAGCKVMCSRPGLRRLRSHRGAGQSLQPSWSHLISSISCKTQLHILLHPHNQLSSASGTREGGYRNGYELQIVQTLELSSGSFLSGSSENASRYFEQSEGLRRG